MASLSRRRGPGNDVEWLKSMVATLQKENAKLKIQLGSLRRAAASTTKVIKANTTPTLPSLSVRKGKQALPDRDGDGS